MCVNDQEGKGLLNLWSGYLTRSVITAIPREETV